MIIDDDQLIEDTLEGVTYDENNYYNVILRDAIFNENEYKYLGKLIRTLRTKNNTSINLPSVERKVYKTNNDLVFDYYYVFDKWLDEDDNEYKTNIFVKSNTTLNAKYNEIKVPKVAHIQIINDNQSMMSAFIIRSSFPIYMNEEYQIENILITISQLCVYDSIMNEYQTLVEFSLKELDDFEGNALELNGQILLFDQNNYAYINNDLLIDVKLNFYRSDASTGD